MLPNHNSRRIRVSHSPRALRRAPFKVSFIRPLRAILLILIFTLLPAHALHVRAQTTAPTPETIGVNETYNYQLAAYGAFGKITWTVVAGSLPPGLTLDSSTGLISGKPTVANKDPYNFTIQATDSSTEPQKFTQGFSLLVINGIRGISMARVSSGAGQPEPPVRDVSEDTPCNKEDAEPLDVESNSDTLTIAVRNHYAYDPTANVINIENRKEPIHDVTTLIADTIGKCGEEKGKPYPWEHDDYVIVHLVKWPEADPPARAGNPTKYDVQKEKWFLYRNTATTGKPPEWEPQTVQDGARIYGHRRVAVLLVHLTARETWDIKYTVDVKGKLPANIQNAIDLAGIILTPANNKGQLDGRNLPPSYWGGRLLLLHDVPSDISVKSDITFLPSGGAVEGLAKVGVPVEKDKQTQQPKTYEKVYDNEGRYLWDVSVGLPVKSFKEVKYDAENGQVTAREVNRQNAYGFLNLFFRKVDTKGGDYSYSEFYKTTHFVLGVPISGKPLDSPVAGLGWGFYKTGFKFNFFAGAVFNRVREPRTLAAGETATPAQLEGDLRTRRVTKFIFGFNIPVSQFRDAITPKKKE